MCQRVYNASINNKYYQDMIKIMPIYKTNRTKQFDLCQNFRYSHDKMHDEGSVIWLDWEGVGDSRADKSSITSSLSRVNGSVITSELFPDPILRLGVSKLALVVRERGILGKGPFVLVVRDRGTEEGGGVIDLSLVLNSLFSTIIWFCMASMNGL